MVAEGLDHGTTSPPTRRHIADWAAKAIKEIPEQIVRNSWRHGEYAYYIPTVAGPPRNLAIQQDMMDEEEMEVPNNTTI
jgi:hypothetical protein